MKRYLLAAFSVLILRCDPYEPEQSLLTDPNFNSWCGESLCHWEKEEGQIRRAATWDTADYGVELASTPSVVSQEANVEGVWDLFDIFRWSANRNPCLKISVLGDVDTEAEVGLELDFLSDGAVDYEMTVPGMRWRRVEVLVRLPQEDFFNLKVSLHKHGTGKAIFAKLNVVAVQKCSGDPVEIAPRKHGAPCDEDGDCESGLCFLPPSRPLIDGGTCSGCFENADCSEGQVCGLVEGTGPLSSFQGCVPADGSSQNAGL